MSEEFGNVQALLDIADNFLRSFSAWLQKVISGPDARSSREAARGIPSRLQTQLLCRVAVEQIRLQNTILNHERPSRGNTFTIERARAKPAGDGAVINDSHVVTGDLLSQFARQE